MTSIGDAGALCPWKVYTEHSRSVFHPVWASNKESVPPAVVFSLELSGSPKSSEGAFNPAALWAHLSALYFSFQREFLLYPLRKQSCLSGWPRDWNLYYLIMYVHLLGPPRRVHAFFLVLFSSAPTLRSFATQWNTGASAGSSPVKAGGAQSPPRLLASWQLGWFQKSLRSHLHNSQCHGCATALSFRHLWCNGCCFRQHPAKWILTNWKLLWMWVTRGWRGWMVWPLSHEEWFRDYDCFQQRRKDTPCRGRCITDAESEHPIQRWRCLGRGGLCGGQRVTQVGPSGFASQARMALSLWIVLKPLLVMVCGRAVVLLLDFLTHCCCPLFCLV